MADRSNNRVSMGRNIGYEPVCKTCPHLKADPNRWGGWCQHPSNRIFTDGWPHGFTPSQGSDGGCDLHPERTAGVPPSPPANPNCIKNLQHCDCGESRCAPTAGVLGASTKQEKGLAACPTTRGNLLELEPNDRRPEESNRGAGEEKQRSGEAGGCHAARAGGAEPRARGGNAAQHEVAAEPGPSAPAGTPGVALPDGSQR